MLLEALVACAGVTLRAVATSLGIAVEAGRVRAEGDLDFRGTLAVDRDAPVGFSAIRLSFELDTDADEEQLETLLKLTERYCVVFQTLADAAAALGHSSRAATSGRRCPARCATSASWRRRGRRGAPASATTARRWPSWRRGRWRCRPGSRSNGSASPATGSATRARRSSSTPTSRGCRSATCCCAGRRCPTRRRSTASSTRPARWSACSSATPTSTTRSTRRRSPAASAARPTARTRWSTLMGLHGLAEQTVEVEPYRTYELGPVRGQLHPQRPLEAAARPRRPLRRRPHLRAPRRPLPERLPLRPGLGDLDRGRRGPLLPPGQRQPDRRRDPRARRRRLPRRRRRPQLHPRLLEADPAPARPALVVPTHYDNFFRPLGQRMEFVSNVQLSELPDEIGAVSADDRARRPPPRRPLGRLR